MSRQHRLLLLAVLLAAPAACSPAASGAAAPATSASPTTAEQPAARAERSERRNPRMITAGEIRGALQTDAYALVQALRPQWLRMRGRSSMLRPEGIKVYQDGAPLGGIGALSRVSSTMVQSIEFLDGIDATQRYGTDHGSGAILVRTGS